MNNKRRKKIKVITENLEQIVKQIGEVLEEEQESRDNTPEGFEERIEELENNCEVLEDAYIDINSIIDNLQDL